MVSPARLPGEGSDFDYDDIVVIIPGIGTTENFGGFEADQNTAAKNLSVFFVCANFRIASVELCKSTYETLDVQLSVDNM